MTCLRSFSHLEAELEPELRVLLAVVGSLLHGVQSPLSRACHTSGH